MNTIGYLVIVLIGTFFLQFTISFFFTFKIRETARDNYTMAAWWGGITTFLFTFTILLNALIPSLIGTTTSSTIIYIVVSSIVVTIANVLGTLLIPVSLRWYENKTKLKNLMVNGLMTMAEAKQTIKANDLANKNEVKTKKLAMRNESHTIRIQAKEIRANEKAAK